jgi:hypothetical protein
LQKQTLLAYFKKFNLVSISIMSFTAALIIIALALPAAAVEIGGKLSLDTIFSDQDQLQTDFNSELELELLLPEENNLNLDAVFVLRANSLNQDDNSDFWVKKLNLSRKIGPFQAQLGRQPISWSYGSLLNPIDYSLGAENLDQETDAKFLDGLELYYPLSWKTGFTLIVTDSEAEANKWALRGRTLLGSYDLTANYIREPAVENNGLQEVEQQHRFSLTAKGDLGPLGVYGVLSSWQEDNGGEEVAIYQLGGDYSHYFLAGSNLYLQGELLRIDGSRALSSADNYLSSNLVRSILPITALEAKNIGQKKLDFLTIDLNYTANEFLSYGLTLLNYLDDGSTALIPRYNYTFSSNLQLELRGLLPLSGADKLLGGDQESLTAGLSYTF